jgi:hypothetical protein
MVGQLFVLMALPQNKKFANKLSIFNALEVVVPKQLFGLKEPLNLFLLLELPILVKEMMVLTLLVSLETGIKALSPAYAIKSNGQIFPAPSITLPYFLFLVLAGN